MASILNAEALTTLQNLKEALSIPASDTSKHNLLERYINRATEWIQGQTGRKCKARRYNGGTSTHTTTKVADEECLYFDGTTKDLGGATLIDKRGCGVFYLPQYPVRSNTETGAVAFALAILSTRDSGGGEVWDSTAYTELDEYIVDRNNGTLRLLGGRFSPGQKNYRVTMAAGFVTIPDDLEQLCIELAKQMFKGSGNVQSESIGTWSRTFKQGNDPFIADTLAKYSVASL